MGVLVPDDFLLSSLANEEERSVVAALCDRLSDDWVVMPDVGLTGRRDRQIDVVIAHERHGIAVIEVKAHRLHVRRGQFYAGNAPLDPQPDKQASENAYALRDLLRASSSALDRVRVEYAIALPNTIAVRGHLPPDLHPAQLLTSSVLVDPVEAIDRLMSARWGNQPIGPDGLGTVVAALRPDVDLEWDPEARAARARRRLRDRCRHQTRALEPLDINRRVLVTGGAGSGKTHLASAWTRRAADRGERVLLTCYNDPLGEVLAERFSDNDSVVAGAFLRVAFDLPGMPPLEIPADADQRWWETVAVGHLQTGWPEITDEFDAVIVDEAQDFNPAWLAQLEQLLRPGGPRRMMLLADEAQSLFHRGFTLPAVDDSWTRCELSTNCRNTFQIASILYRTFEGSAEPAAGPESLDVRWTDASALDAAIDAVGVEIDRIELSGVSVPRVLVATTTRSVRNRLREAVAFVAWEDRSEHAVVCENVQRVKGLEFDHVILVVLDEAISDLLLYVGLSRAVAGFSLVSPPAVAARLGLVDSGA